MMRYKLDKRGQITIVLFVGILILLATALFFYVRNELTGSALRDLEEPKIADVPEQFQPIKNYVDSCIKEVAVNGLKLLGERGGYIDMDGEFLRKQNINFREKVNSPTESDFVRFGDSWEIPYWSYLKTKNDFLDGCQYSSKQPPLRKFFDTDFIASGASIESQLDNYMDVNLPLCIDEFSSLSEFEIKSGSVRTVTTVANNDVWFLVNHPLTITDADGVNEIEEFFVKIPVPLKQVYETASEITNLEFNRSFLAKNLRALITIYSGIGGNKDGKQLLPPMSGGGFDLSPGEIWTRTNVKKDIEGILTSWMGAFQVEGSKNYVAYESDPTFSAKNSITQVHRNMGLPVNIDVSNFDIKFNYLPVWDIYFDVNSDGELIKAESIISDFLPLPIGLQQYNTVYDISYPVLIEIRTAPTAEFQNGYAFMFALEGNLRHNEPFKCGTLLLDVIDESGSGNTLLCDNVQRSSNLSVSVVDFNDGFGIEGANVVQDVASTVCPLGETVNGNLTTSIAPGFGMFLTFDHKDYLTKAVPVDLEENEAIEIEVELEPVREVKLVIRKIQVNSELQPQSDPAKLSRNDQVVLNMYRERESVFEEDFTVSAIIEGDETPIIRIPAGVYEVNAQLLVGRSVVIPAEVRTVGSFLSKEKYELPDVTLPNPHPWGGLEIERVRIPPGSLDDDTLVVTIFELPEPVTLEDIEFLSKIGEISKKLRVVSLPR